MAAGIAHDTTGAVRGAKAAIRRSLREEDRERFVKLGQELARVAFEHVGRKVTDKALKIAAKHLGRDTQVPSIEITLDAASQGACDSG